jgi:hypothetical protein
MSAPTFTCPRCGRTSHNRVDAEQGYCGYCHDWTRPQAGTHPLRFRVWVDAELVDEAVSELDPERATEAMWEWLKALAERHAAIANAADETGSVYLIEVEWWDGERTRWGTDVDGMVVPVEVGLHDLAEAINRRWL